MSSKNTILNYTTDSSDIKTISILNVAGMIDITSSADNKIKITAILEFSDTFFFRKEKEKYNAIYLKPQIIDGVLLLEAKYKNDNSINYWNWLDKHLDTDHVKLNYKIEVPKYIVAIKVYNAVGDITINNISSAVDIESYTGQISGTNLSPGVYSKMKVYTGNISLSFKDINKTRMIANSTGVGTITINLPNSAYYKIDNSQVDDPLNNIERDYLLSEINLNKQREWLLSIKNISEKPNDVYTIIANKTSFGFIKIN